MSDMIRKYYPVVKAADGDSFFISMMSPDLEGDVVVPEGLDVGDYLHNPVVLYLHDGYGRTDTNGIPVGTTKGLEMIPGVGIKCHGIDWLKPPRPPITDWIQSAWEQRKLRGASIGFISTNAQPNRQTGGKIHSAWKLLEWSVVPLPMHPQALRHSAEDRAMIFKAMGIDDGPVTLARPDGSKLFLIDQELKESVMTPEGELTSETKTKDAEVAEDKTVTTELETKMPMPEDMPPDKVPMGECVARGHEYMARAAGAMAEGAAQAHAAGDEPMAAEMGACEEDMMAMCGRMGQMMKAMRKPEDMDEPHKPMMTEYSTDPADLVTKQGNTLNKSNRGLLKVAIENIKSVLASARAPEDVPAEPEPESAEMATFSVDELRGLVNEVLAEVRR